ncbi:MAG: ComF family protein [Actinomycetota bacterium]|nr:ComF family protein [Actinomycetota bacterium]
MAGLLARPLLKTVFPSNCPVCGLVSDVFSHSPICSSCWNSMPLYEGPRCNICGEPLVSAYSVTCQRCIEKRPAFTKAFYYGLYSDTLKEAINAFKFSKVRRLGAPLARLLSAIEMPEADAVAAVPVSKKSILARGFNQSLLLGKAISDEKGLEFLPHALLKTRATLPQSSLNREERLKNLRGVFKADACANGLRIILADDVITTCATAHHCAKALLKAGAKEVFVLALARTPA